MVGVWPSFFLMLPIVLCLADFCIAKIASACWHAHRLSHAFDSAAHRWPMAALVLCCVGLARAETGAASASPPLEPASMASAAAPLGWVAVPRASGRLGARDIGLVINSADPYS